MNIFVAKLFMMKWLVVLLLLGECAILGGQGVIVARSLRAGFDPLATYDIALALRESGVDTLTAGQFDSLQAIAAQCPQTGGPAVFKARALLSIVEDTDYDDYAVCSVMGLQPMMRPNEGDTNSGFKVFPNPASSELQVVYKTTTACKISLTDVFGREVLTQVLAIEAKNATLLVANLPSGMYFCKITNARGDTEYANNILIIK